MKYKINYNGKYEDSIIIEGDNIEEIKVKANIEEKRRGWDTKYCWSEEVE